MSAPPVLLDLMVVGGFGVLAVAITRSAWVREVVPLDEVSLVLVSVAAALAAMAAMLAAFVHRLSDDPRAAWISAGFATYGLVGVPATTIGVTFDRGGTPMDAVRLSAHIVVVALLLVAARPPRRRMSVLLLAVLGLAVIVAAALLATLVPTWVQLLTGSVQVRFAVAGLGIVAGVLLAVPGWPRGSSPLVRVGVGTAVVSFAHAYKIGNDQQATLQPGLAFASVRLLGVSLVVIGLVQLARSVCATVNEAGEQYQEELLLAQRGLRRAAERDHEMRNGLAGLAGVTHLVSGSQRAEEAEQLRMAVTAELTRLASILRTSDTGHGAGHGHRGSYRAYPIGPVLRDLVVLRRSAGMDIRYDADTWLWAEETPDVLTQVLTNVVANCARHAPGSPVRVQACRRGDRVRVRVTDFGPGVASGSERKVFERGVRGAHTDGRGLGLHICRELLAAEGGGIEIRPSRHDRPGALSSSS